METITHIYDPKRPLLLLEYRITSNKTSLQATSSPPNVLLFVGGLYDNFRSPRYVDDLAALFPRDVAGQAWRVMHVQLSTNGRSWGLFDLDRDVKEIAAAITYIRDTITQSPSTPVVLMGHSTGCQDLMHYLISPVSTSSARPNISGAILQAPVSDREAILHSASESSAAKASYEACLQVAYSTPREKHKTTIIPLDVITPLFGPVPVTVFRFLSLASPDSPEKPAMDDYYSSDLSDQRLRETFGLIGAVPHLLQPSSGHGGTKSLLILQGANDQSIPPTVDKPHLLSRWKSALESTGEAALSRHSLIIPHAKHDISGESKEARRARLVVMRGAVLKYLEDVVGGIDAPSRVDDSNGTSPWAILEKDLKDIESGNDVGKSADTSKL
ncbi:uncharacterized protein Z520_05099 [Fonsecaea multimorphosa CBS 102226]|uniref:AB hydrolase-1 domain-containing protein n=1 Tax=Fonsecaea multimorphosa CBS 102226 TaxID=1442371 RepID=A0A0D2KS58_9EURO|nr:uncharacterized protein Z520_05099 [Fonsecaea multimorphosa CBS 102226]KIX99523.1 hypothetical protein Z520_05099 [Fonsecaea multimorphosa CBS 102226]OAL25516.1 hypothetical protein AYO22_04835 [Fonsecaea multimorphosa]